MSKLLSVRNLSVCISSRFGDFMAVDSVNLELDAGQIHGLVGESGAGKSTIGAAIIGLLETPAQISAGTIELSGEPLQQLDEHNYHRLRGKRISMIFQDPQTSLNPLLSISDQLVETIRQHREICFDDARRVAIDLLQETGIENAEQRMDDYPHQFSGGMRQRVVIALALCTEPELIIADEPTTALDVSIQKQILQLIRDLAKQRNVGVILITHDIGVIAEVTDKVTVLRYGRVVEHGNTSKVLGDPDQTYTQQLMSAVPRIDQRAERFVNIAADDHRIDGHNTWQIAGAGSSYASTWLLDERAISTARPVNTEKGNETGSHTVKTSAPLVEIRNLSVVFGTRGGWFRKKSGVSALDHIALSIRQGEVLGVVGESGSGKSTLAKAIVGLVPISTGSMHFNAQALPPAGKRSRTHPSRRQIQMVFQDPYSSLNNRRTVEATLTESLLFYGLASKGVESRRLIASVLELVGMPQRAMLKYPHQFSGGQRQRIAIARALMARPDFLICDEPTSALDVSIQAQILNLLKDLQQSLGLTIMFISHNLAVVRQMADTVMVLRGGKLIETAPSERFFSTPVDEYSQQLLRESPSLALLD
ncbi:MAG: dipeptide ABC transporter ATP-binding protein [Granulosicoccus sp.]